MSLSKAELNKSKSKWSSRETEAQKWASWTDKGVQKIYRQEGQKKSRACHTYKNMQKQKASVNV